MSSVWDSAGYDDSWKGGPPAAGGGGGGDPQYDAGEGGNDPFAYTHGSLLTPWEGHFDGSRFGGGGSGVADYKPFQYGDFNYKAANPGTFDERYNDPGNFTYGDFNAPGAFKAPTQADMEADPGYLARVDRGSKVLEASKAAQGLLRTGGTAKGLVRFGQEEGSQEYGNLYARKRGEYDTAYGQSKDVYGINRGNATENFDRNVSNARQGYGIRQGAFKDNAAITLDASRHGYEVASGMYDRNEAKARQGYEDEAAHNQAVASASAAGANRAYDRALDEYRMGRDEFWTNQDRQYNILDHEANRGYEAARDYGSAQAGLATDRGNAQAAGRVGSANAWNGALGSIGQNVSDTAIAYAGSRSGGGIRMPSRGGGRSTSYNYTPRNMPGGRPDQADA